MDRPLEQHNIAPALGALDRALGDEAAYEDLVEATRCLVALRRMLIAERRRGQGHDPARRLERLNAILSLVAAAEYPLEGARHERIATAHRELASLV